MTVLGKSELEDIPVGRPDGGETALEPASMDLHLGPVMKYPQTTNSETVAVDDPATYPTYGTVESKNPLVRSGSFALGSSDENIEVPKDKIAYLHGRSSVGRLGLFIENAGLIDPGFTGEVTLEFTNVVDYDIELVAGMRIGQLTFHEVSDPPDVGYSEQNGNKYDEQQGPTPSRLHEDF
jgi:deoxycytidine triphosphate deaminase